MEFIRYKLCSLLSVKQELNKSGCFEISGEYLNDSDQHERDLTISGMDVSDFEAAQDGDDEQTIWDEDVVKQADEKRFDPPSSRHISSSKRSQRKQPQQQQHLQQQQQHSPQHVNHVSRPPPPSYTPQTPTHSRYTSPQRV